jgi:glycosyltransferase involved in cell wall biosynthesis
MLKNKDIICVSVSDWLKPWGSKQHLMTELAKANRVLYIEYQSSILDLIIHPRYFLRILARINKLRKVNNNIYVYNPLPLLPFGYYCTFICRINQYFFSLFIRRLIKRLSFKNPILWSYAPSAAYLVGKINEGMIIYHCGADFIHEKINCLRKNAISKIENRLANRAHIVLTLTKDLQRRFAELNSNTFYFPSAVDMDYFSRIRESDTQEPQELAVIKKPLIGVVGYLDGNILDMDLLEYIARANPQWSIVMIGPLFRKIGLLHKFGNNKNVYFLGEKPPASIPLYLKYLDVCLVPYIKSKFTSNVSPIKLYEYLAMGKPVVSTFFSEDMNDYKSIIGIADDKGQFLKLIRVFLNHKGEKEEFMVRINAAAENSWQKRLDFLSDKLNCIIN